MTKNKKLVIYFRKRVPNHRRKAPGQNGLSQGGGENLSPHAALKNGRVPHFQLPVGKKSGFPQIFEKKARVRGP